MSHRIPRQRYWVAIALLAVASAMVGTATADERPSEIVYDTPGEFPQLDPSYRMTSHKVVLITDQALNPQQVTLEAGQLVAWISYSSAASTIVFEREVAKSMVCHSLVNFAIDEDELRSAPIHAGEFASFCELKPGKYNYKIKRPNANLNSGSDARRLLEGQIIVGGE